MKRLIYTFLIFLLPAVASAQCAMCKAVVESNAESSNNIVEGVNSGILYLMGIPYLLMMVVGIAWYKKFGKPTS